MEVDFSTPQTYTVTAEDGSKQDYLVSVSLNTSADKAITAFTLKDKDGTVVGGITSSETVTIGDEIAIEVPLDTDLQWLVPTIEVSAGASVARLVVPTSEADADAPAAAPQPDTPYDFSAPVRYVVTAQNGSTHEYLVTVTEAPIEQESLALKIELVNDEIVGLFGITTGELTSGIPLSVNGDRREVVISLTAYSNTDSTTDNVQWKIDGSTWSGIATGDNNIVTIKAKDYTLGRHYVAFTGTKDDGSGRLIPYSKTFYFTVDID
jgi:hypothetical protein